MGIVFGASILSTLIDEQIDNISCPFPDYANGINATQYPCSIVSKPETYTDDNFLGVPTGYFNFFADFITSIGFRALSLILLIRLVAFPVVSIALLIPQALAGIMFGILLPFTAILYIMLGIGTYKVLSPFASR